MDLVIYKKATKEVVAIFKDANNVYANKVIIDQDYVAETVETFENNTKENYTKTKLLFVKKKKDINKGKIIYLEEYREKPY